MARTRQDAKLNTRSARIALKQRSEPYWRSVSKGLAIGYFKGANGGTWIARHFSVDTGRRKAALGVADDFIDADGIRVLSFDQAQAEAHAWHRRLAHLDTGEVVSGPYTVAQLMEDYLKDRQKKKRKDLSHTRYTINAHILPILGKIDVAKLTRNKIETWRDSLAGDDTSDPEKLRKKQATANRIFTILKAALNFGYKSKDNRIATKAAWEKISPFRQVDAPKIRHISISECKRLIEACPNDFRKLVRAALYTGGRYSEIASLRVSAFDAESNTIHIAMSKSGKARTVALTDEGTSFFKSVADSKGEDEFLFTHEVGRHKGKAWAHSQQTYHMNEACEVAEISPAISYHILRHTYASQLAMSKTPMPVIAAQLGHADTRMTERHYAHLGQSYIADVVRANLPSFGFQSGPALVQKQAQAS
jgi:integrase